MTDSFKARTTLAVGRPHDLESCSLPADKGQTWPACPTR